MKKLAYKSRKSYKSKAPRRVTPTRSELNPPKDYPTGQVLAAQTQEHRERFTSENSWLRGSRNMLFWRRSHLMVQRQLKHQTDRDKRIGLRLLAESLVKDGFYSSNVHITAVEHRILTKLYRYEKALDPIDRVVKLPLALLVNPDSNKEWAWFCDHVAGESYLRLVPYNDAIAQTR